MVDWLAEKMQIVEGGPPAEDVEHNKHMFDLMFGPVETLSPQEAVRRRACELGLPSHLGRDS